MQALVYNKNLDKKIKLTERDYPKITDNLDVIVEVKISSICTSDLHIINGFVPFANNNIVLGHEFAGEVVETGKGIKNLKKGDRVAANCITFCGECYFCRHGYINNCIKGGWELGCKIDGGHAEYVRIPFGDTSLTRIPDNVSYENALFVGDILSSGYFAAEMCEINKGDTIAVIGSGPVGLCAMMCAKYMGASKVIAIDKNEKRLETALNKKLADYTINPDKEAVEEKVKELTNSIGADGVIEAAGEDKTFQLAWKIARPNAIIGIIAMYEKPQILPLSEMYGKNLTFKTGGVDAIHCQEILELISQGKISTDFLITHKFPFNEIEKAYKLFANRPDNCLKIAIYK